MSIGVSCAMVAAGFLLGMWPLSIIGIVLAVLWGRWVSAILFGIVLDVAYGVPPGLLHVLYFPITVFTLVGVLLCVAVAGRLRTTHRDTL